MKRPSGHRWRVWERVEAWLTHRHRGSYGLAVMRIGFGAMAFVILAIYLPDFSYFFGRGAAWGESLYRTSSVHDYLWPISVIFTRAEPEWLMLGKTLVLMAAAGAFALGWRTRVSGPVFVVLWLGFAGLNPVIMNTGHYQTFRIMLLFLLLTDSGRRWSLDSRRRQRAAAVHTDRRVVPEWLPVLANNIGVVLIAYQLCVIYVTSALWKLQGRTWVNGVAVYYPLQIEELTIFPSLNQFVGQLTPLVYAATWISVLGQLLFPVMLLNTWTRRAGLLLVSGMHVAIGVLLAIPWFSLTMLLADTIFVKERTWLSVRDSFARLTRRGRRRSAAGRARDHQRDTTLVE